MARQDADPTDLQQRRSEGHRKERLDRIVVDLFKPWQRPIGQGPDDTPGIDILV